MIDQHDRKGVQSVPDNDFVTPKPAIVVPQGDQTGQELPVEALRTLQPRYLRGDVVRGRSSGRAHCQSERSRQHN
jgi:hypothetical protein